MKIEICLRTERAGIMLNVCFEPLMLTSDLPDEFRFVSWPAAFVIC